MSSGFPAVARVLLAYAASRLVALLGVAIAMLLKPGLTFRQAARVWDVGWYLDIASNGYPAEIPMASGHPAQNSTAFFPLFPLVVRAVDRLTPLDALQAGVVLALLGGAVTTVLLWLLVRRVADGDTADRAAVLLGFFPGSFVFLFGYSEALMLPLAVGALLALAHRKWVLAGLLGALATASRPNGIGVVLAAAGVAFVVLRGSASGGRRWQVMAAPVLAASGIAAYAGYLWLRYGDPFVSWSTQRYGWGQRLDGGRTTVTTFGHVFDQPVDVNVVVATLGVIVVAGGALLMLRWRPPLALTLYTVGVIVPPLLTALISSRPRFAFTAFPLVVAYARAAKGVWFGVLVGVAAACSTALVVLIIATQLVTP